MPIKPPVPLPLCTISYAKKTTSPSAPLPYFICHFICQEHYTYRNIIYCHYNCYIITVITFHCGNYFSILNNCYDMVWSPAGHCRWLLVTRGGHQSPQATCSQLWQSIKHKRPATPGHRRLLFFCKGKSMNAAPHYHTLRSRATNNRGNHRDQPNPSAM